MKKIGKGLAAVFLLAAVTAVLCGCGKQKGIVTEDNKTFCYDENGELVKGKFIEAEHDGDASRYTMWYFSKEDGLGSKFIVDKVNTHITAVVEPCSPIIYLIEGDERVLVIDAGTGIGDLDELIQLLTDKPYTIWMTHAHYDHIGGAYTADCDIFLNDLDLDIEKLATAETRLNYAVKRGGNNLKLTDMAI